MPEVIDKHLFRINMPIPPGESIETNFIDVSGAQHLTVNVVVHGRPADLERTIVFAHKDANLGGGAVEVRTDTFGPEFEPGRARLMTLVPVHGTDVQVILRNNGSQPAKAGVAWIYGVR